METVLSILNKYPNIVKNDKEKIIKVFKDQIELKDTYLDHLSNGLNYTSDDLGYMHFIHHKFYDILNTKPSELLQLKRYDYGTRKFSEIINYKINSFESFIKFITDYLEHCLEITMDENWNEATGINISTRNEISRKIKQNEDPLFKLYTKFIVSNKINISKAEILNIIEYYDEHIKDALMRDNSQNNKEYNELLEIKNDFIKMIIDK